jgi:peptide deformylase
MTVLAIAEYPNEVLRRHCDPVDVFSESLQTLVKDMVETLASRGGIGLSAPQVCCSKRIVVTEMSGDGATPEIYINPEIISRAAPGIVQESCLSLPGVSGNVVRSTQVTVSAQDINGHSFEQKLTGMHAVCLQHEIDHLDGVLLTDRMISIRNLLVPASVRRWFRSPLSRSA